ncbi:MAG: O-methyltransferase, partial [Marmoricola sp.]
MLARARSRAEEVGCVPIGTGAGAALRFIAATLDARSVVEIGTGTGVSGLWLLRGMRADGILTSVDVEAEHQRLARET